MKLALTKIREVGIAFNNYKIAYQMNMSEDVIEGTRERLISIIQEHYAEAPLTPSEPDKYQLFQSRCCVCKEVYDVKEYVNGELGEIPYQAFDDRLVEELFSDGFDVVCGAAENRKLDLEEML